MTELILYPNREATVPRATAMLNWGLRAAVVTWRDSDKVIPMRSGRHLPAHHIVGVVTDAINARNLGFYVADYANRLFTISLINRDPQSRPTDAVAGEFSPGICLLPKVNGQPMLLLQQAFRALSITCDTLLELERRGEHLRPLFPPLPPGQLMHNFSQFRL